MYETGRVTEAECRKGGAVASRSGILLREVAVTFRVKGAVLRAAGRGGLPLVRGYSALRRAEAALVVSRERLGTQGSMEKAGG